MSVPKTTRAQLPATSGPARGDRRPSHDASGSRIARQLGLVARRRAHGRERAALVAFVELLRVARLEQLQAERAVRRRARVRAPSRPTMRFSIPTRALQPVSVTSSDVDREDDLLARAAVRLPPVERRGLRARRRRSARRRRRRRAGAARSTPARSPANVAPSARRTMIEVRLTPRRCSHTRARGPSAVEAVDSRALWTSTSTRGRSSSGATGFRCRTAVSRPIPAEARAAAEELGCPVVVKAQVLTGGRGKAGGIKLAATRRRGRGARRARSSAWTSAATSSRRSGSSAPPTSRASTTSRSRSTEARRSRCSCSRRRVAWTSRRSPRRARTRSSGSTSIRSRAAIRGTRAGSCTTAASTDPGEQKQIAAIVDEALRGVRRRPRRCSARSTRSSSRPTARCARSTRSSRSTTTRSSVTRTSPSCATSAAADPLEALAREKGVTYVKLDGEVGVLGNGAGLTMSTVDVVTFAGGRPANFCDLGGGGDAQGVVDALEVITRDEQVRAIFFNIFGGITRCDEVARGHPAGGRADGARAADRRAPRRDERRGGPAHPAEAALPNLHTEATMLDGARRAVELAA